jgi:hypothetical protein
MAGNRTLQVTTPSDTEIVVTRLFDAPRRAGSSSRRQRVLGAPGRTPPDDGLEAGIAGH